MNMQQECLKERRKQEEERNLLKEEIKQVQIRLQNYINKNLQ